MIGTMSLEGLILIFGLNVRV